MRRRKAMKRFTALRFFLVWEERVHRANQEPGTRSHGMR
ncbi:hypothetical protein PYCH_05750 [Pyrococcus yayanosii CH1]|uniref:Uncharacterized protein n=1 Tax=Pyrococcus yayanosii (strain CH1 / JCM 16557) TaxID=529709 RepID=F8AHX4_PYRYC|nr:hypothetical protein PYCH_05750 [Pyrococcus yayanosii CH1]